MHRFRGIQRCEKADGKADEKADENEWIYEPSIDEISFVQPKERGCCDRNTLRVRSASSTEKAVAEPRRTAKWGDLRVSEPGFAGKRRDGGRNRIGKHKKSARAAIERVFWRSECVETVYRRAVTMGFSARFSLSAAPAIIIDDNYQ